MGVEYGGILCIKIFIPGETHVGATKFWWPCDIVSENLKNICIAAF